MNGPGWGLALRPAWVARHLAVLLVVTVCVSLGMWQLRRLDERRERNAVAEERAALAEAPLEAVLPKGASGRDREYRLVRVSGTYALDEEVLLGGRALGQEVGFHALTPLQLEDGGTLLVDRGWMPAAWDEPGDRRARPPAARVEVAGLLVAPPGRGRVGRPFGPRDEPVPRVPRIDLEFLQAQVTGPLRPLYLELATQRPAQRGRWPIAPDAELPSAAGPHLSYALQWFVFALIALTVHLLVLRRAAHPGVSGTRRAASAAARRPPPPAPPSSPPAPRRR